MPTSRKPKAYSYIRFSTPEQAKGDSLARQLRLSKEYAEKNGLELDETLSMRDLGLSGYKKTNITKGALGQFIAAVEQGKVPVGSLLLVESLDRLSRAEIIDQLELFLSLTRKGITIVTLSDGMKYSRDTMKQHMNELLISLVIMSRGYEESATKSRRLKSAWKSKREQCDKNILTARCPAWLKVDKAAGKFIPIPERCEVVQRIFQLADGGIGKDVTAKRLNKDGVPVFGRGNGWHSSYVQKILENRAVLGEFQPHRLQDGKRVPDGEPLPTYFPRVISDEVYFRTLNRRKAAAKVVGRARTSNANLFSGLLKCGYTNGSIVYSNKGKWQYLVSGKASRGIDGVYTSWAYKDFETSFFAFLAELSFVELLDDEWKTRRDAAEAELAREWETKSALEKKQQNLVDAIAEGNAPKAVLDKINELDGQLKEKDNRISALQRKADELKKAGEDAQLIEQKTGSLLARKDEAGVREQLRQEILRQVEKILLYPGGPKIGAPTFQDWFFVGSPVSSVEITSPEELQNEGERIIAALNESLTHPHSDETPTDRSRRYFTVYFKTGAIKQVMPHSDSSKFQKMALTTREERKKPKVSVQSSNGVEMLISFDSRKKHQRLAPLNGWDISVDGAVHKMKPILEADSEEELL